MRHVHRITGIVAAVAALLLFTDTEVHAMQRNETPTHETAVLGGGCFWCMEAVFEQMDGVYGVVSGYAGGDDPAPTYKKVCGGGTGHAEVVRIDFDPSVITYERILDIFFEVHDPTTLNRQGADVGTQYRSLILYTSEAQRETAERVIADQEENGGWGGTIVTQVEPLKAFHIAEDYHQDYFRRNPGQGYCQAVVAPKVKKAKKAFPEDVKH